MFYILSNTIIEVEYIFFDISVRLKTIVIWGNLFMFLSIPIRKMTPLLVFIHSQFQWEYLFNENKPVFIISLQRPITRTVEDCLHFQ